jgi:serine/threonine-protein kinase
LAKLEKIGKYEILGQIAAGGFGVVYKARDPFIKRLVAIKTCPADNEDLRNRFFREAEIVGNLKHPNITIVHDFGVEGDFAYLVQEYLSGEDLLAKIREKRALELSEKLEILLQVAQGLGYAHSQGVIHRDVKPGNIRVLEDAKVKIMDFGIAKLITARTQLTQKGMTVGTVGYLAPEQVSDGEVTQRTDIFGFGVLAYEFLTYRRPFRGRTLGELIPRIMKEEPPPVSTLVVDATPALDALVAKCLAKNPTERYASFDEVIDELGGILSEAQLAAALPGDVVEQTVRLSAAGTATPSLPAPTSAPTAVDHPEPTPAPAPVSAPSDEAKSVFEDTRPVLIPEELAAISRDVETELDQIEARPQPPEPASEPLPQPRVESPQARALPTAGESPNDGLPPPDPDLSMSGFAPPPLPAPPGVADERADDAVAPEPPNVIGGVASGDNGGIGLGRVLVVAFAGLIVLVGLIAAGWYVLGRREVHQPPVVTAAPAPAPVAAPRPTAAATGMVVVVAAPWGTVERVIADDGTEIIGAPFGPTPVRIEVPAGTYRIEVAHPELEELVSCEVVVAAAGEVRCEVTTAAMDVNQYFRDAGWWR